MPRPPVGGRPYSSALQVVLVNRVRFIITCCTRRGLHLETLSLIERIVQLRERVGVLGACDHQFEPLRDLGIVATRSSER